MKWDQLVHTVSLSTTSAKCSKSMNHILVTLKWLNIFYYCVWHESMLWWVHCESPKITKNYLHVDIKCASLKYRIIQYKEPINYGKEHKESTKLQETKYILQIYLDAIFFLIYPFSYIYFTCQSRMFQMWLSFATAFTSALKSSDWTQKIIQIHDDLPLLTTDFKYRQYFCWNSKSFFTK